MKIVKFIEGSEVVLRKLPNKEAEKFVNEGKGHFVSRGTWRQYQNTQNQIEGVKRRKNNKFIKPFGSNFKKRRGFSINRHELMKKAKVR